MGELFWYTGVYRKELKPVYYLNLGYVLFLFLLFILSLVIFSLNIKKGVKTNFLLILYWFISN